MFNLLMQQETFLVATWWNRNLTSGNFKIHTFTGPGTFDSFSNTAASAAANNVVDYLVGSWWWCWSR